MGSPVLPTQVGRLLQEIDREAPEGVVTAKHLDRMPYVEACIKEALRIYSPAALLGRQLGEATVINGHTIPKGTGVMVRIHCAQLHCKIGRICLLSEQTMSRA